MLTKDQRKIIKQLKSVYYEHLDLEFNNIEHPRHRLCILEELLVYLNSEIDVEKIENNVWKKWRKDNRKLI